MNTSLSAYTHLESLLLFQSLHAYGVEGPVFSRVSELLKSNPHITSDKRFQVGRLSPDALHNFYLLVLKEEIKSEQAAPESDVPNGEVKGSRKRKIPSPSLNVQESLQHQHLIPKLVNKLYAHYRAAITEQIRHDEEQYDKLHAELQRIEHGEWDEQLKEKAKSKATSRSPSLARKSPLPPPQPLPGTNGIDEVPAPASGPEPSTLAPPTAPPPQNGQAPTKTSPGPSPRKKTPSADERATPSTPQPQPRPPLQHPQVPPTQAHHPTPNGPLPASATHNGPQPFGHQPPYPQLQPPTGGPQGVPPGSQHIAHQGPPHSLQPGNVTNQFQQPILPSGANGVPQFPHGPGTPLSQYPLAFQRPPGPHDPSQPPSGTHTPQQQRGYPPYPGPPHVVQVPSPGGVMLPPWQVPQQDTSRVHQQAPQPLQNIQPSTPISGRQLSAKATPQTNPGKPGFPMHPGITQARQTASTPTGLRTPQSAVSTPRSARTTWKISAQKIQTPAPRPEVSPIDDFSPVRKQPETLPKPRTSRKSRAKTKAKEKEPEPELPVESDQKTEETVPEMETRQGRSSRRKAPVKRGRPGSIASSQAGTSARERSRSHSILSHTETIAADNESQAGGRIKLERGASVDVTDGDVVSTPSHMPTRRRGGAQPVSQPNNKRKRNMRDVSPNESEDRPATPGLQKTVIAPRHFSRMCTPLMNDIGSHKHASTFTTAVKAKDAEGYYDIIKRPTDLKSIQKAIAAGAKQVAAAASGDTPSGSPGGGGGVVELPTTAENMPPKAIVNSAQLEKELMRMFVNAVMFNSGEEGVVEDARQMFQTVQLSVSSWRSVEPSSGRMEVEETPLVLDEDMPTASKRRKL